ncbi:hypothetical protein D9757_006593 [Collybiopsis confluens]|uniref:Glycoside hydrolase n=1 Tax=Collybiopsis confluens TaxID=2823264 RepID=A0A8H5HQQ2_9AGAR|nr:hypothetical protein D9757_006593 [Collybiopsis confluens]
MYDLHKVAGLLLSVASIAKGQSVAPFSTSGVALSSTLTSISVESSITLPSTAASTPSATSAVSTAASTPSATSAVSTAASTPSATSAVSALSSGLPATITAAPTFTSTAPSGSDHPFPPVGSVPRDYSPQGLEKLWDIVGPVEVPPITTTVIPQTPVVLPSPPPPLYPSFFAVEPKDILPNLKFPKGFAFGVDSAAYQVEGAVKEEGKGPNMWDWASRQPGAITDNSTADVVDLHYFLYKEDAARIAALGVNAYSFSISWSRIFPFGAADSPVNQQGLAHYADVIATYLKFNINPVVTLFHWDLPLALNAYYGGFTSPNVINDFVHYAKTVFTAYNGSVHTWYTFNEPQVYCAQIGGYPFNLTFAPGINVTNAQFQCSYNLLKAHAGAVNAFREMHITGEIAFKSADYVGMPWRSNNTEDAEAVERHAAFGIGVFADPVYTTGDWPQILKDTLSPDILPRFSAEDSKEILGWHLKFNYIRRLTFSSPRLSNVGTADFFAMDAYRTYWNAAPPEGIDACANNMSDPLWPSCNLEVLFDFNTGWASGPASDPLTPWLQATPQFVRPSFIQYHKRWPSPKIIFSEFGFTQPFEGVRTPSEIFQITEDPERTNYYMTYLGELLLSIHEDGLPVTGAFAWAITDNAEWNSGLSARNAILDSKEYAAIPPLKHFEVPVMFAKTAITFLSVAALASSALAAPVNPATQSLNRRYASFDGWNGISSLSGFDNFYGSDNFSGEISSEVSVSVEEQEEVVVCHSLSVEIIQQKLLVLQEMAKRIITEQICEVETQTIVFQQYISSSTHFVDDIMHTSDLSAGYDSSIVSHYGDLIGSDGSLSTSDLGFSGSDVGQSYVVPSGSNWNPSTSPASVQSAFNAAQSAA